MGEKLSKTAVYDRACSTWGIDPNRTKIPVLSCPVADFFRPVSCPVADFLRPVSCPVLS